MWFERWRYTLPLRWRAIVRRRDVERDLDDEITYHLEREIEAGVQKGMSPAEARRLASRRFGPMDPVKERCRDARGLVFFETLLQDIRYSFRVLKRDPGFAAVAVLTLALGIGGTAAMFSMVDAILLTPLPYAAPDRLVAVTGGTYPNGAFAAMREAVRSMEAGAYAEGHGFTLTGSGEPVRLRGARISAELFSLLGERPALGRWLRPGEDEAGRDRYVVLSHDLWQSRFNGDPAILGRFIELNGEAREVIAVMPPAFRFPSAATELWVPLGIDPANSARYWAGDFMPVVGRLRPGATIAQATAEVKVFQSQVPSLFPWQMPSDWNRGIGVVSLQEAIVGDLRSRLMILMAAVALVLVIACANVTNLGLSKAAARGHEIRVRAALGAGPRRIARQLLTENLVLAALGAVVGVVLATQAIAVIKLVLPPDTPRLDQVYLSWRVLVFTGVVALATGCAAGLVPAVQTLRLSLRAVLRSGARGGRMAVAGRFRAALTIAQIASAVLLVIAAGLLVRSLWALSRVDPGFGRQPVVTARISPSDSVCREPEACMAFYRTLEERLQGVPGIGGVAFVNTLPLTGAIAKRSLELEGYATPDGNTFPLFWLNAVTPDYFRVMQIRLESGRPFTFADLSGRSAVAIVTASTARRFWPGENPIGRHVRFVGEQHWHTIVGVVADVRGFDLTRNTPEWIDGVVYVPHGLGATLEDGQLPTSMTVALHTSLDRGEVAGILRRAIAGLTGEAAVSEVRELREVVADSVSQPAATTTLLVTMGLLALVLGCVGVYGVLSYLVSSQTRDVGIRLALGAQARDVFWLVMKEGAILCGAGIALGLAAASAASRVLASELYGVRPTDPATYAAVAVAVSIVTLAACYLPTRRAMAVDPIVVLQDP